MKMQNKEIVDFLNTCVSMKKKSLPVRLAYAIKKNVAAVQEAASAYTAEREELIRRYAKKDENGEIMTEDDCYIMEDKALHDRTLKTFWLVYEQPRQMCVKSGHIFHGNTGVEITPYLVFTVNGIQILQNKTQSQRMVLSSHWHIELHIKRKGE